MSEKVKEFITGIMVGLMIVLMLTVKTMAAPLGQTIDEMELTPHGEQIEEARQFLSENGILIPKEIEFYCNTYGKQYDICPEILEAMCWVESNCKPTIQSPDNSCKGLMQIKPSCHTARMNRLNARNVFGVWENILIGTDYLAELAEEEDIAVALAKYNGVGDERIEKVRQGEYTEYVNKVLRISQALERVHYK